LRRPVTEVIRRGLDNAVANWQLLLLRIAESILFGLLIIGTAVAVIVPLAVAIGLSAMSVRDIQSNPDAVVTTLVTAIASHWIVLVYAFVAVLVLLTILVLLHSFVISGCAQVYVDADRAPRLRVFAMDRWLAGARHSMWPVFWIYNAAYSVAGLIILVPALLVLVFMLALREAPAAIVVGCLGLLLVFFVMFVAFVLAGVWCQKAIVVAVANNLGATDALREAWREIRTDFGRHFAVAFIMIVISFGGVATLSAFSVMFSMPGSHDPFAGLMFAPARMVLSLVQSVFSAAVGLWMLACFAALGDSK
jgi:hypothetical protein